MPLALNREPYPPSQGSEHDGHVQLIANARLNPSLHLGKELLSKHPREGRDSPNPQLPGTDKHGAGTGHFSAPLCDHGSYFPLQRLQACSNGGTLFRDVEMPGDDFVPLAGREWTTLFGI